INRIIFNIDDIDEKPDIILVLGNPNILDRINKCLNIYRKYKSIVILSGGALMPDNKTEAEAMRDFLIINGVNINDIILENKSKDTIENIKYSVDIINELELGNNIKISLITSGYHIRRAMMIFNNNKDKLNKNCQIIPNYSIDSSCISDNWYKEDSGRKKISVELEMIDYMIKNMGYKPFEF
ncbi:MAG: YdcF family protein, partial [Acholeplasmatales bacterium]|nr:YdcF family protein [Acholeplasmatales bacterium]